MRPVFLFMKMLIRTKELILEVLKMERLLRGTFGSWHCAYVRMR